MAASKLLFGVEEPQQLIAAADQLKKLLADWCKVSLYPGPRCQGEPHGVVIGCALVAGGDVQGVDPWGGRRYVVHYPLLAHWGAMFGIAPLDLTAQRFFTLLCCLAGLPGIGGLKRVGGAGTVGTVGRRPRFRPVRRQRRGKRGCVRDPARLGGAPPAARRDG